MRNYVKIAPVLIIGLTLVSVLTGLNITRYTDLASAAGPTPTPPASPSPEASNPDTELLCRLETGLDCSFVNPVDMAAAAVGLRTYPKIGAQDVPTYTLVSVTFDQDIDPDRVTIDTFFVEQGSVRIPGSVEYISAGKMAIFHPAEPLLAGATYTATLIEDVRDLSGAASREAISWAFTTTSAVGPATGQDLSSAATILPGSGMKIYFGDLHGHTGYSDGHGVPADAFTMARASGLDFYGLTEHGFMMDEAEWIDVKNQANAATIDGQFVGLPGFEYSHERGHINVFGSDTFVRRDDPRYRTLADFYAWLVAQPTAIGQFNHPNDFYDFNFNDFLFHAAADRKMVLQELTTAGQFFQSMNNGWHLGTVKNRDTHTTNWGCCPLMGVVASSLTRAGILEALASRRTFFVSPDDSNLAVMMQANGYWMGSALPNPTVANFSITVHDPDPLGRPLRLVLYDNGIPVASTAIPSRSWYNWNPSLNVTLGHYYYVGAYYDNWYFAAYSSPIWIERPPIAVAAGTRHAAPGTVVELDGKTSWDPDGDALGYEWVQQYGVAANVIGSTSVRPSFIAPAALGDLTFRLTVIDTGSLSDSDTVRVTITDKPVLVITKLASASTESGDPIVYTLTVTNIGASEALGVVITDALPVGATYLSGGTLQSDKVVVWNVAGLAANGGVSQHSFEVSAAGGIVNDDYGATCGDCIAATGNIAIFSNLWPLYLPTIQKN
jgi:uncharacterized repeat protein (TIGR01451 family)